MNAKEAREIAVAAKISELKEELTKIINDIKKACGEGNFSIYIYRNPSYKLRESLEELGYIVGETTNYRNEYSTEISW